MRTLPTLPLSSNGDVDMRTLPPIPTQQSSEPLICKSNMLTSVTLQKSDEDGRFVDIEQYKREAGFGSADPTRMDVDIRSIRGDMDIRNHNNLESITGRDVDIRKMDVDTRQQPVELFVKQDIDIRQTFNMQQSTTEDEGDDKLEIVINDETESKDGFQSKEVPLNLPKRQRELYMRIQAQQKENLLQEHRDDRSDSEQSNIDWYSDDSNEGRLTIKCDEEMKDRDEEPQQPAPIVPTMVNAQDLMNFGDLSKINISEEVTKLLSSMRQNNAAAGSSPKETNKPKDPRQANVSTPEEAKPVRLDPRKARLSSTEDKTKPEKVSIYEQGSIDTDVTDKKDVDLRSMEKDMDLRSNFGDLDLRGKKKLN